MSLSSVLNCCRYLSLEACGTAQSLDPVFGELLANDVVDEEFELLDPRSSSELALDMPSVGEKAIGEEKPDRGSPAEVDSAGGVRRLPLGSPWFPMEGMRGRVMGVGIRGWRVGMGGLAGMGVSMGIADMGGMGGKPIDRFGIEPIPKRAEEGMLAPELDAGVCFMIIGRDEGRFLPWSLSLISFIAMENSNRSIFPSLSMSARFHISARTEGGRPDWRKNFLACSPETKPSTGARLSNCLSCFPRSSGVMAQMLAPPFMAAGGQKRGESSSLAG